MTNAPAATIEVVSPNTPLSVALDAQGFRASYTAVEARKWLEVARKAQEHEYSLSLCNPAHYLGALYVRVNACRPVKLETAHLLLCG